MATEQQKNSITAIPNELIAPALLWVGQHDNLVARTIDFLQQTLCTKGNCKICVTCNQVNQQEHHSVVWIKPEKQYTLDDIEVIHRTIAFKLEENQKFFFVLQKADYLTQVCANSLLKSIEEPPNGYHFILLTERHKAILPTVVSRCLISSFYDQQPTDKHDGLFQFFTGTAWTDPFAFLKELDASQINEPESRELLDKLLVHWIDKNKTARLEKKSKEEKKAQHVLTILKHAMLKLPMPGSSKLFWKHIFIQMKET